LSADFFSDITATALVKTLDATAARQKTIANNIANVETPGYKRSYVSFEAELRRAAEEADTHSARRAVAKLVPIRRTDVASPCAPNGNNVNIDAEIADLARNAMKQKAAAVLLEAKIAMLRAAIMEGKR